MNLLAYLSAQPRRVALAVLLSSVAPIPGFAQALNPQPHANTPEAPAPQGPPVQHIVVTGTQRIETATVLSYVTIHPGDAYDEQTVDKSLKTLFATGLFADVKFNWDGATLTIEPTSFVNDTSGTITVASGRCTWLPMPLESAAGSRPMQADSVIIRIGRICSPTAWNIASNGGIPLAATR